jgi:hypothetical protein
MRGFGSEATVTFRTKSWSSQGRSQNHAKAGQRPWKEQLDKDYAELQSFRETSHAWDGQEWQLGIPYVSPDLASQPTARARNAEVS